MSTPATETPFNPVAPFPIPPLREGERLARAEFERRYDAMPPATRAELIEGVVSMPSPVRAQAPGRPHFKLIGWLSDYERATPGTEGYDNTSIRLDMANEPQPDALLRILPDHEGYSTIDDHDYITGGPELVVAVSASAVRLDLGPKFAAYLRNSVQEYLVWKVQECKVDWFALRRDRYELLPPSPEGWLRSEVFPRLWSLPAALFPGV